MEKHQEGSGEGPMILIDFVHGVKKQKLEKQKFPWRVRSGAGWNVDSQPMVCPSKRFTLRFHMLFKAPEIRIWYGLIKGNQWLIRPFLIRPYFLWGGVGWLAITIHWTWCPASGTWRFLGIDFDVAFNFGPEGEKRFTAQKPSNLTLKNCWVLKIAQAWLKKLDNLRLKNVAINFCFRKVRSTIKKQPPCEQSWAGSDKKMHLNRGHYMPPIWKEIKFDANVW